MPSNETVNAFVAMIVEGRFVEAMERFCSPDYTAQENNDAPRVGLPAQLANERKVLATFKAVRGRLADAPLIDGDRVAIHWIFEFDHPSGTRLTLDEVELQTWRGDAITAARFYYDPRQLR